jgi:hypothetical protein
MVNYKNNKGNLMAKMAKAMPFALRNIKIEFPQLPQQFPKYPNVLAT